MNEFPGAWNGDTLLDDSTGFPFRLAVPPVPDTYFPIDFTHLYLGIDDSDQHVARVVCLDGAAIRLPRPICTRCFKKPEKLLAYVKSWIRASGSLHVALTRPNRISGPTLKYLEEFEGIPVTRLGAAETLPYEDDWEVELDYIEAFCIALTLAYRESGGRALDDLQLLTTEAEEQLRNIRRGLARLRWANRVPF